MLHGTDPDPYLFESGTRTRADPRNALNVLPGPDHYSKVGPEPGWEDRPDCTRSAHIVQQMLLSQ